jgi:hypothetical protein
MPRSERTLGDMVWRPQDKRLITLWHVVSLAFRTQDIEKTVEFSRAYETHIADLHRSIWLPWTWVPEGMSVLWKHASQLLAKDIVVGHRYCEDQGKRAGGGMFSIEG